VLAHAEYATIDTTAGSLSVTLHRVAVDRAALIGQARTWDNPTARLPHLAVHGLTLLLADGQLLDWALWPRGALGTCAAASSALWLCLRRQRADEPHRLPNPIGNRVGRARSRGGHVDVSGERSSLGQARLVRVRRHRRCVAASAIDRVGAFACPRRGRAHNRRDRRAADLLLRQPQGRCGDGTNAPHVRARALTSALARQVSTRRLGKLRCGTCNR
jgi:hypothetical protein